MHTAWVDGDPAYEEEVVAYAQARCSATPPCSGTSTPGRRPTSPRCARTCSSQKLIQLTMPGVPDVYQGCEIVMLSLVDPDNRRPVDWTDRGERLDRVLADEPAFDLDDEKLRVTARALGAAPRPARGVRRGGHDVCRAAHDERARAGLRARGRRRAAGRHRGDPGGGPAGRGRGLRRRDGRRAGGARGTTCCRSASWRATGRGCRWPTSSPTAGGPPRPAVRGACRWGRRRSRCGHRPPSGSTSSGRPRWSTPSGAVPARGSRRVRRRLGTTWPGGRGGSR